MADTGFLVPTLTVSEVDGSPRRYAIQEIEFPNGSLTVSGNKVTVASSSTSPGGSDTQVQFNDSGAFAGDSGMTFNKTSNVLTVTGGGVIGADSNTGTALITYADTGYTLLKMSDNDQGTFRFRIASGNEHHIAFSGGYLYIGTLGGDVPSSTFTALVLMNAGTGTTRYMGQSGKAVFSATDNTNSSLRLTFPSSGVAALCTLTTHKLVFGGMDSDSGSVTEYMRFDNSTSRLGILTTAPKATLHVVGSTILACAASAVADNDLSANGVNVYLNEGGNTLVFKVKYADGTTIKSGSVALA